MSRRERVLLPALTGLALLASICAGAQARAGGFTLTSFGDRRSGMMANLGRPDDPTALIHNPAGLADLAGVQLYLSVSPAFLSLDMEMQALDPERYPEINPAGCGEPGLRPCPWPVDEQGYYKETIRPVRYFGILPYLGASTDLGFVSPRAKEVVLALSVHAPNFYGAYFPEDAPTAYSFIEGMFLVTAVTVGAGWRINRYLCVGASASYNYMTLSMAQKLSMVDVLTPRGEAPGAMAQIAQIALGDIRLDFEGVDHGVGWGASLLITPAPWLGIGLGYAGASPARFRGDVAFTPLGVESTDEQTLRQLASQLGYKLPRELEVQMAIPPALVAGINLALGRRLELALDARFWLYDLYQRQIITPVFDPDDPGKEPITEDSLSRDKDYHLSYQVSGGVLGRPWRRLPGLELMAGAGYDRSPIPGRTLTIDNPSLSQVKASLGVRWQVDGHWRVAATYLLVVYLPCDIRNSQTHPPNNLRGSGTSHSPGLAVTYRF